MSLRFIYSSGYGTLGCVSVCWSEKSLHHWWWTVPSLLPSVIISQWLTVIELCSFAEYSFCTVIHTVLYCNTYSRWTKLAQHCCCCCCIVSHCSTQQEKLCWIWPDSCGLCLWSYRLKPWWLLFGDLLLIKWVRVLFSCYYSLWQHNTHTCAPFAAHH